MKYQIMGYEISLRHTEAAMIEIIPADNAPQLEEEEAKKLGMTNISQTADRRLSAQQMKCSTKLHWKKSYNKRCFGR